MVIEREFSVRGKPSMLSGNANASGAKVEYRRGLLRSRIATVPPLRCPLLKTARSRPFGCNASPRLSASSINSVGWVASIRRKIAAVEIASNLSARAVSRARTSSNVVLPQSATGLRSASLGVTMKRS